MIAVSEYLLKVLLCSAVFTGYYWLALRNKLFHHWNRFYLLGAVVLSICIPFVKFTILQKTEEPTAAYQVLQSITTEEKWFEEDMIIITPHQEFFTKETIVITIYGLVSVCILLLMVLALIKIIIILRQNPHWKLNGLTFVDTEAKGTPFSFLHYIFWNRKIDFESVQGRQIFSHELIHVQEKHSWDKLFINFVLVFFWINPFFWLMKKELTMIHEFIADKKAVANGDTSAFAAMILAAAFPGHTLPLTNPFFYSPIKRRLLMLSKLNNPRVGYFGRLLLLPLLTLLFAAFSLKTKKAHYKPTILNKEYIVVIDAGHGFDDGKINGAKSEDGYSEDEFALSLVQKVTALNKNEKLKIILTRSKEQFIPLKERSEFTAQQNPDLFISLHAAYAPKIKTGNSYIENPANGIEAFISSKNPIWQAQSNLLGTTILKELSSIISPNRGVKTRDRGIWVLDQSTCPAVLLECGFLTNKKDLNIIKDKTKQDEIAVAILRGIEIYLNEMRKGQMKFNYVSLNATPATIQNGQKDTLPVNDTEPIFTNVEVDAQFPGGRKVFHAYINDYLEKHRKELELDRKSINNSSQVQFIVEKNGTISNIEVLTNTESKLASLIVALLKNSPRWEPAKHNGMPVRKLEKIGPSFFTLKLKEGNKDKEAGSKSDWVTRHGLFLMDGKIITREEMVTFFETNPEERKNIHVNSLDGNSGRIQFGEKGKNGVLEVITKQLKPIIAVAPAYLNILYSKIENPLRIAVSGVEDLQLNVSASQGTIIRKNGSYIIKDLKAGEVIITVKYSYKNDMEQNEELKFKVIPENEKIGLIPNVIVAGSKGGRIEATKFKEAKGIELDGIDNNAEVLGFTFYATGNGVEQSPFVAGIKGGEFTSTVLEIMKNLKPGSTIVLDEIRIATRNGIVRGPVVAFNLF
jgi:N-acetylmuramoyl-L-alanine amidase